MNVSRAIKLTASIFKSPALFTYISMADPRRTETISTGGKSSFLAAPVSVLSPLWFTCSLKKKKVSNLVQPLFHNVLHEMIKMFLKVPLPIKIFMSMIG